MSLPAPKRPVRPQLSDEAAIYVRALIMSGELPPGASVRVELIAEALGISTTPAREALQALRVEGFLELVPRKGFQVARLTGQDIRDLYLVQALVAGELAARAAAAATGEDLDRLGAIHGELEIAARAHDVERLEELNHEFHRAVNTLGHSGKIHWMLGLLNRYVPRLFYATIPGWPELTMADHGAILAALLAHDPEAARAAMHRHIVRSGDLLAENFDERLRTAVEGEPSAGVPAAEDPSLGV